MTAAYSSAQSARWKPTLEQLCFSITRQTHTNTLTHAGVISAYLSLKGTCSGAVGGNQSTRKHPHGCGESMQIPQQQWHQPGVNCFFSSMLLQTAVEQNNSIQEPVILQNMKDLK